MLEFVPPHALGRLLWIGGWWLVLVASWVTACVWIDEDARRVFGTPMPWSLLFVTAGASCR
jgi:hypothetical protein